MIIITTTTATALVTLKDTIKEEFNVLTSPRNFSKEWMELQS